MFPEAVFLCLFIDILVYQLSVDEVIDAVRETIADER